MKNIMFFFVHCIVYDTMKNLRLLRWESNAVLLPFSLYFLCPSLLLLYLPHPLSCTDHWRLSRSQFRISAGCKGERPGSISFSCNFRQIFGHIVCWRPFLGLHPSGKSWIRHWEWHAITFNKVRSGTQGTMRQPVRQSHQAKIFSYFNFPHTPHVLCFWCGIVQGGNSWSLA